MGARGVGLAQGHSMRYLADRGSSRNQFLARLHNVGNDEISAGGPGRSRGHPNTKVDRTSRSGRRELHDPKRITRCEVGIEAPAETDVKPFGSIDVGYRDDDHLDSHIAHSELLVAFSSGK